MIDISERLRQRIFVKYILRNPWIQHEPTLKQTEFLVADGVERLFGGAAGGGKSDALLMAALEFVDEPGYSAILFRRTYSDLSLPGALMDRANVWLRGSKAKWDGINHRWTFPSGAKLQFGYLEHEDDKYRYQSAEFTFIGFDELTQFTETQYRYMLSRLRRLEKSVIPLRMFSATNPGGVGHAWVKQYFLVEGPSKGRVFVPARLDDNPFLDRQSYQRSLEQLDPVNRRQLLEGDWNAVAEGKFRRHWFTIITNQDAPELNSGVTVRYWDLASLTASQSVNSDWTVGILVTLKDGQYFVRHVDRFRLSPKQTEERIRRRAEADGREVRVWMEEEPGSSGKIVTDHYAREVLQGFSYRAEKSTGSKEVRADPVASAAEAGNVFLLQGDWINDFLDELCAFPSGAHDDQIDALSGAFSKLTEHVPLGGDGAPSPWR